MHANLLDHHFLPQELNDRLAVGLEQFRTRRSLAVPEPAVVPHQYIHAILRIELNPFCLKTEFIPLFISNVTS
jgi:hypothetical protein